MDLNTKRFEIPDKGGNEPRTVDPSLVSTAKFSTIKKPPEVRKDQATGRIVIDERMISEDAAASKAANRLKAKKAGNEKLKRTWGKVSPLLALLIAIGITALIVVFAVKFTVNKFFRPVDVNDPTPIEVVIPRSSGASTIAKILYEAGGEGEKGLIVNKALFKVYVDFIGKSSGLKAGTYILSRNMSMSQIVDIICTGNPPRKSVRFTISEGVTCEGIARKLVEQGILKSPERFLELCTDAKSFADKYWFVKNIVDEGREGRLYMLEGYLFPDTYEVFEDATEEEVIEKMLDRFNDIYSRKYIERAEELDLTLDDVVILASMIEKEAKKFDFNKVSAVFHLRLQQDMPLHSDATLGYILKTQSMEFSQEELDIDSPYNTYKYSGLPAGPISNPGAAAIEAVLYPNEQFMEEGYLFFCLMDGRTGALVFAKTAEEHAENVEKYKPFWN